MAFRASYISHERSQVFRGISDILDRHPELLMDVQRDLCRPGTSTKAGRPGLRAEVALRALIVKRIGGYSYAKLAYYLLDSTTYQSFCRISPLEKVPKKSTLAENLGRISAVTLEKLNRLLVLEEARSLKIESGDKIRVDSSVVPTNIHHPTDSSLLLDSVQSLTRILKEVRNHFDIQFADHTRRAKRRSLGISNAKPQQKAKRTKLYKDLLVVTRKAVNQARNVALRLRRWPKKSQFRRVVAIGFANRLDELLNLVERVIDQTTRRVLRGESVDVSDKIVSLFEPHTDIIKKGAREVEFGHKVFLTTGASCLILDCVIKRGNPSDPTMAIPMLERHKAIYGRAARQAAFDPGFTSMENLERSKEMGVEDVAYGKKSSIEVESGTRSPWVYRQLSRFRAGIEGCISFLKRCFGLDRCTSKGIEGFEAYVWSSILAANLVTLARRHLAT